MSIRLCTVLLSQSIQERIWPFNIPVALNLYTHGIEQLGTYGYILQDQPGQTQSAPLESIDTENVTLLRGHD